MSWIEFLSTIAQRMVLKPESNRPIGLRPFHELSDDDVLNHLSKPSLGIPQFSGSNYKKVLAKPAPSFVKVAPAAYSYQNYRDNLFRP